MLKFTKMCIKGIHIDSERESIKFLPHTKKHYYTSKLLYLNYICCMLVGWLIKTISAKNICQTKKVEARNILIGLTTIKYVLSKPDKCLWKNLAVPAVSVVCICLVSINGPSNEQLAVIGAKTKIMWEEQLLDPTNNYITSVIVS